MKCLQCASRSLFLRVVSSRFKPHSIRTESLEKQCFGLSFLVRKNKNKTRIVVRLAIMVWLGIVYKLKPTGVLKNVLQRKHAHINILVNNILSLIHSNFDFTLVKYEYPINVRSVTTWFRSDTARKQWVLKRNVNKKLARIICCRVTHTS